MGIFCPFISSTNSRLRATGFSAIAPNRVLLLECSTAQASSHEWQPWHRSRRTKTSLILFLQIIRLKTSHPFRYPAGSVSDAQSLPLGHDVICHEGCGLEGVGLDGKPCPNDLLGALGEQLGYRLAPQN